MLLTPVEDFGNTGGSVKLFGVPPNKTEDKKVEKQHPTASTHIHDNLATADFVTQPLVSPSWYSIYLRLCPFFFKVFDYIHCFADEFFLFLYFFLTWSF
jgi:hypothetical protein